MDESTFQPPPKAYEAIIADTRKIGFMTWCHQWGLCFM